MSDPSALTDHLGFWLRQLSNHVSQSFARKLEAERVTVAEWVLMRVLHDEPSLAPSRAAEALGFTRGAITKLADRLIAKRLVVREGDPQDGRAQKLALTPEGRRLTPKLAALADENDAECFGWLADAERRTLHDILERGVARLALSTAPVD